MCRIEGCTRHVFDWGFCLDHIKEYIAAQDTSPQVPDLGDTKEEADAKADAKNPNKAVKKAAAKKTTKKRVKAVDNIELMVNDDTTELETR